MPVLEGHRAAMIYLFEDYALDTDRRELLKADRPVAVQPQVFDVLALLIANRSRVVTKDEIIEAVWDGRAVSEIDADQPDQCSAQCSWRQRRGAASRPHSLPQGFPLRRRGPGNRLG